MVDLGADREKRLAVIPMIVARNLVSRVARVRIVGWNVVQLRERRVVPKEVSEGRGSRPLSSSASHSDNVPSNLLSILFQIVDDVVLYLVCIGALSLDDHMHRDRCGRNL